MTSVFGPRSPTCYYTLNIKCKTQFLHFSSVFLKH